MELLDRFKKKIPKDIWKLNKIFADNGFKLYIVGGFIRDFMLHIYSLKDIDLCGTATPEEFERILANSPFKFTVVNKKLGAYKIKRTRGGGNFEYVTLREEKYKKGHTPQEVNFITEIDKDVQRRDFTVNAMYFDLSTCELIDPCNGVQDCMERKLKPVNSKVFDVDGLRIMRMIRFAYTKRLKIDEQTFINAKLHTYLLKEIAHERIVAELRMIDAFQEVERRGNYEGLFDDSFGLNEANSKKRKREEKYNNYFNELDLMDALFSLHTIEYIFPKVASYIELDKFYEAYYTPKNLKLFIANNFALSLTYHICKVIEKAFCVPVDGFIPLFFGNTGLMFRKSQVLNNRVILDGLLNYEKMNDNSFYINFIQLYYPVLIEIIYYTDMINKGKKDEKIDRILITDMLMQVNGIPRHFGELAISGLDIINKWPFLPKKYVNSLLECAFIIATKTGINKKRFLLKELERFVTEESEE